MNSKELILKLKEVERNNYLKKEIEYRQNLKELYEKLIKSLNSNQNYFICKDLEYKIIFIAEDLNFDVDNFKVKMTKKGIKKLSRELRRTDLIEIVKMFNEVEEIESK